MHACSVYFRKGHDAAAEFAFERTLIVDLFLKVRKAKRRLIKNLKADSPAGGQSFTCQLDANLRDTVRWNSNAAAVAGKLVLDIVVLKFRNDALRFLRVELGIQHLKIDTVCEVHSTP